MLRYLAISLVFVVVSCSKSSSGGGNPVPEASPVPPGLYVAFPGVKSLVPSDRVTVLGSVSGLDVNAVTIDGVPVETGDGFSHWSLEVQLASGVNTLEVLATTPSGQSVARTLQVARSSILSESPHVDAAPVAVDSAGRLFFTQEYSYSEELCCLDVNFSTFEPVASFGGGLKNVAVDPATGRVWISHGIYDPLHELPGDVLGVNSYGWAEYDPVSDRLIGVRSGYLYELNLDAAVETTLIHLQGGSERSCTLDFLNNRVFCFNPVLQAFFEIPLEPGSSMQPFASVDQGTGPWPQGIADQCYVSASQQLLAVETATGGSGGPRRVFQIDVTTGDRTVLLNLPAGLEEPVIHPGGIWASVDGELTHFDLSTGTPEAMTNAILPFQPLLGEARFVPERSELVLNVWPSIERYDLNTGVRSAFLEPTPFGVAAISGVPGVNGQRVFIGTDRLWSVDLDTEGVTEISGPTVGGGEPFGATVLPLFVISPEELLALSDDLFYLISTVDGSREVVYQLQDNFYYSGVDPKRRALYVWGFPGEVEGSFEVVLEVDLATGSEVIDPDMDLSYRAPFVFDGNRDRLILGGYSNELDSLDLATGMTTTIFDGWAPTGVGFLISHLFPIVSNPTSLDAHNNVIYTSLRGQNWILDCDRGQVAVPAE